MTYTNKINLMSFALNNDNKLLYRLNAFTNLGIIFGSKLLFLNHINHVIQKGF